MNSQPEVIGSHNIYNSDRVVVEDTIPAVIRPLESTYGSKKRAGSLTQSGKHQGVEKDANVSDKEMEGKKGAGEPSRPCPFEYKSTLQNHCQFFDPDGDGIVWPQNTFFGFRQLGFNWLMCFLSMLIIHATLSYPTVPNAILPDPFARIFMERVHRDKHGSDSGCYDNDGEFLEVKFDKYFERYSSRPEKDGLTVWDTVRAIWGQRCSMDFYGISSNVIEWMTTWMMFMPADGVLKKEDVRKVFDGSMFWKVAGKRGVKM